MAVKDIILDDAGDLEVANGDFVVSESDMQHIELIVNLAPGSLKQYPTMGVGIWSYSGSSGLARDLQRNINVKLDADGYKNISVRLLQGADGVYQYNVDAERK